MVDDSALPAEVQRLITETLSSMDHVEILFRVSRRPDTDAEWLSRDAHMESRVVANVLHDLVEAGLLIERNGAYSVTENQRDRAAVNAFAEAYNARPVTLVRAIYARSSPVRTFADAFRLRRKE